MAIEIERKFLVLTDEPSWWGEGVLFRQGYLSTQAGVTVRVRIAGTEGWLTIKGPTQGASRSEFEYPIPVEEAAQLLDQLCQRPLIEKTRYRVTVGQHLWEVDRFHGDNDGLVVAEVELEDEAEAFSRPAWLGQEVTGVVRYYNSQLVARPFSQWSESERQGARD